MAIVGGGYTGLAAARALARRGVDVTVLERHEIGWGASSRNGGFVLPGFKPDVEVLARKLGVAEARRLFELSEQAVEARGPGRRRRRSSATTPGAARSCSRPGRATWWGSSAAGGFSATSSATRPRC